MRFPYTIKIDTHQQHQKGLPTLQGIAQLVITNIKSLNNLEEYIGPMPNHCKLQGWCE